MIEALKFGDYAFYVWTAYAIAAVLMIANVLLPLARRRRLLRDIEARWRRKRR